MLTQIDFSVLDFIAEHLKCSFLDTVMPLVTYTAEHGLMWILVAAVLLVIPKTRKLGAMLGLSFLLGFLVGNLLLKNVVARPRPYWIREEVELLVPHLKDFSFPSGHTLVSFEAASVLLKKGPKRIGVAVLVLAVLVAFSRLYLYVHYPTDVLASMVLSTAFGLLSCFLMEKAIETYQKKQG